MRSCLFECHVLSTLCFHTIDLWSIELERINERNRKKNIHSKNCILNCSFGQRRKSAICRFLSFYKFIIVYLAVLYASAFTYTFKSTKCPPKKKYISLWIYFLFSFNVINFKIYSKVQLKQKQCPIPIANFTTRNVVIIL